jgi:hypothetical protein
VVARRKPVEKVDIPDVSVFTTIQQYSTCQYQLLKHGFGVDTNGIYAGKTGRVVRSPN